MRNRAFKPCIGPSCFEKNSLGTSHQLSMKVFGLSVFYRPVSLPTLQKRNFLVFQEIVFIKLDSDSDSMMFKIPYVNENTRTPFW